jgi:ketosteroid isomerase-like protein
MKTASALIVLVTITIFSALSLGRPKLSVGAARLLESRNARTNDDSMQQQIVAKEREGLEALKTGDVERFGNLTAEDAVFVDTQGSASKAQVLKNVAGFTLTEYSMQDVRFVPISASAGLISYKVIEKGVSRGKEFAGQAYVSSIWIQRGNKWVCLFSQETETR